MTLAAGKPPSLYCFLGILLLRPKVEVIWIYTFADIAGVQNTKSFWNWPLEQFISNLVRSACPAPPAARTNFPISLLFISACPKPTA